MMFFLRIATLPLLLIVSLIVFAIYSADYCGNDILSYSNSPNGKLKAVVFLRDCGATTGFSYQISIIRSDKKNDSYGNVFIAEVDSNKLTAPPPKWINKDEIMFFVPAESKIIFQATYFEGKKIIYKN